MEKYTISLRVLSISIALLFIFTTLPVHHNGQMDPIQGSINHYQEPGIQTLDSNIFEEINPTRARYLESTTSLDSAAVQLTVYSGNAEDNLDMEFKSSYGSPSITTGDIDNDGFDDLIIGSTRADGDDGTRSNAGQVMVIYGGTQQYPYTKYDQANDNTNEIGLVIHGADGDGNPSWYRTGDMLGNSVACGDIDGDDYEDIIIGALYGDSDSNGRRNAGEAYVIFGNSRDNLLDEINLQSTAPGMMIKGENGAGFGSTLGDLAGFTVVSGDVIGDYRDDIIISAPYYGRENGRVYIIEGDSKTNLNSDIDLRSDADVVITGNNGNLVGYSLATGDVNGDSRDDLVIGAMGAQNNAGVTFVVYGKQTLSSSIDLNSDADIEINGDRQDDYSGWDVTVGNINGDSYDDIVMSAPYADGLNNGLTNSGEVYVIYGSPLLASTFNLRNGDQDLVIYGVNANDNFGYDITSGNMNNDQYSDLLIGSKNGDGESDSKNDCGETYLILGNSTSNLGNSLDPSTKSESIFYGIDDDDYSGRVVSAGDLDGDSFDDVIISAPGGDGPSGGRDDAGEAYVVYGNPPPLKNEMFSLLDGDLDNKTIFTRYKPYTFIVNVSNILGYKDLRSVTLTIDPLVNNIVYRWSKETNKFTSINDPHELVECVSTSSDALHDSNYNYSIYFRLIFDWAFNKSQPITCKVTTLGQKSLMDEDIYPNVFNVNNKLNLKGDLTVKGSIQGELLDSDWVRGGEELSFSGPIVVYDGTTDYFPPLTEYSIYLEDNTNQTEIKFKDTGDEIDIKILAPELTVDNDYKLKFHDIPEESDSSDFKHILRVDNDPPNPPDFIFCKADSFTELEAAQVDNDDEIYLSWDSVLDKGSGTVRYYYSFDDKGGTEDGFTTEVTTSVMVNATEGYNTFYVWSEDAVGNIGLASSSQIFVDLTEVTFENFEPIKDGWFNSELINCSIQIFDTDGFGIDRNSIEYWDIQKQSWVPVDEGSITGDIENINITVQAELIEGTNSTIKFRAKDLAGNGPSETSEYKFNIDTTPVTFTGVKPDPELKLKKPDVKCYITVEDLKGSGVDLSTIQYSYSTDGLDNFTKWTDADLAMLSNPDTAQESSTWFVDLTFIRGGANYVRWRAKDIAGNGYKISEPYNIIINALPVIIVDEISDQTKLTSQSNLTFNADQTYDLDDTVLAFTWHSNISGKLGEGEKLGSKLPAGHHMITLTVYDGYNNASYDFNLTINKPKKPEEKEGTFGAGESFDYFMLILIIIIIIIIIIYSFAYSKERKKRKMLEKEAEERAAGPEVSYIPPRSFDMVTGASSGPPLPGSVGGRGGTLDSEVLRPSPYGSTTSPDLPSLPTVGGIGTTPTTTAYKGGAAPGRQLPQLPPAQPTVATSTTTTPTIATKDDEIDTKKKLELLEKKMLLGDIPVDIYTKLTKKYEEELKIKSGTTLGAVSTAEISTVSTYPTTPSVTPKPKPTPRVPGTTPPTGPSMASTTKTPSPTQSSPVQPGPQPGPKPQSPFPSPSIPPTSTPKSTIPTRTQQQPTVDKNKIKKEKSDQ